ncbi:hypothetical protein yrohd0001_1100 [Yersinia rohdei ATCC 43380]|nr:hypothetical protein yrohd0001_1100 [Yersinia rohdei ATCC 43380]
MDDPASSGFKDKEEEEKFITDGCEIAQHLQDELGSQYEVIYHSEY